jgi:hypothetical protein
LRRVDGRAIGQWNVGRHIHVLHHFAGEAFVLSAFSFLSLSRRLQEVSAKPAYSEKRRSGPLQGAAGTYAGGVVALPAKRA